MARKKSKKSVKPIIVLLLLAILAVSVWLGIEKFKNSQEVGSTENKTKTEAPKEELKPKTFAGTERPLAFMIDNNINAMPQAGLEQADLVYEMIVEGGETRLMAVIKNKDISKIGPLRSVRHYYLDYMLENDAICVHYGQSPQAKADITKLKVDDINGIYESATDFWRDSSRYAPHNAVTSTAKLTKLIKNKEFRTTTSKKTVLNYVVDEVNLPDEREEPAEGETEGKITNLANTVTIPYSAYNTVRYEYDEESKEYVRYSRDKKQTDWNTKNTVKTKNIIITKCKNTTLDDGSGKGRQTLDNVKTLDGYYITNGKYIPIKCYKTSRSSQTVYKDLDGNEIKVNDGKTFIQICPINSKISFK